MSSFCSRCRSNLIANRTAALLFILLLVSSCRAAERSRDRKASGAELGELQRRYELLTPRERQVFQLVTAGLLNKQAGAELGTSEKTIKVHRARVMFKMKAESLAELVRMADQLQIRPAGKAD
jgi:FixJ family two-component response regulator